MMHGFALHRQLRQTSLGLIPEHLIDDVCWPVMCAGSCALAVLAQAVSESLHCEAPESNLAKGLLHCIGV